jgi:hypothetical protein
VPSERMKTKIACPKLFWTLGVSSCTGRLWDVRKIPSDGLPGPGKAVGVAERGRITIGPVRHRVTDHLADRAGCHLRPAGALTATAGRLGRHRQRQEFETQATGI